MSWLTTRMNKYRKSISILCLFVCISQSTCYEKLQIDKLRADFLTMEDDLWSFVLSRHDDNSITSGIILIKKFHEFDARVQQMPQQLLYGLDVVRQADSFLFLFSDLRVIHDLYDKFQRYQTNNLAVTKKDYSEYEREMTTTDIVDDILYDSKNNANKTIRQIYEQMFGSTKNNMVLEVFEIISINDYICKNNNQAAQQVFYNLYNAIALAELKAYMMIQFAYLSLRLEEKGNYTAASLLAREEFKNRVGNTSATLRGAMEITNGNLWKCDPKQYIEGVTYEQLTRLLQAHVQNEVDLNSRGTCTEKCEYYSDTRSYGCYDSDSEYCMKMKYCHGKILDCRFVESHLTACIAPYSSSRRYEYLEYNSDLMMGHKVGCAGRSVNSWTRWFVHCSNCLCLCDEQGPLSDRYFNLRPVMADVANNRVVTGLRFVKHNRIIHLQIQEGKLMPYGYIDKTTVRWVPVDNYKMTDGNIRNGEDYFTMDYNRRSMNLDYLEPQESDHIITGVKFQEKDGILQFALHVAPFNFSTGILSKNSHYVYGSGFRSNIDLSSSDIPTKSPTSEMVREKNTWVKFTHTDYRKDAAQTTVPFIDIQPVTSDPQVPLKAAGIYFKGRTGYGGFIAPKITTYNFMKHMDLEFPNVKKRVDTNEEFGVIAN